MVNQQAAMDRMDQLKKTNRPIWMVIIVSAVIISAWTRPADAATAKSKYLAAERAYLQLKKSETRQKYRDQWLRCIDNFMAVYKHNTRGPWAAAGLYQAGVLYAELSRRSYLPADRKEAVRLFDYVIQHFPKSRYKVKAGKAKSTLTDRIRKKPETDKASPAQQYYEKAQTRYCYLQKKTSLQKYRDQWMKIIGYYRKAYQADDNGPLAAASLYGLANCYEGLAGKSFLEVDRVQAQKSYQEIIRRFPESSYADKARNALGLEKMATVEDNGVDDDAVDNVIHDNSSSTAPTASPAMDPGKLTGTPAVVEGLRYWSNPRYTRVVIDASQDAVFTYHELKKDPSIGKPQRIYIDILNSRLGHNLKKVVKINDDLLSDARAGQYTGDTVRVVVDIKSFKNYQIFPLKDPYRIVLDVWGVETDAMAVAGHTRPEPGPAGNSDNVTASAIVKQLALGVRRIVIDPGHGGRDYGAPGYLKGVHEKDIVLKISKRLAAKIKNELDCEVILTRSGDTFPSLEERTAIANTREADLFISIHANASPNKNAYGMGTFILNLATDDEAIRVAARENATSAKNISDLDSILHDLMQHAKVAESTRLAGFVHNAMLKEVKTKYSKIRNKGVKQAPFYVLLGAKMPSILIETSFISNPRECKRLTSDAYQERLCRGIVAGIKQYIQETKPITGQLPAGKRHPG
jgi:N-acetylmuramoyl-L-alanine amidase